MKNARALAVGACSAATFREGNKGQYRVDLKAKEEHAAREVVDPAAADREVPEVAAVDP